MKRSYFICLIFTISLFPSFLSATLPEDFFPDKSILSEGKWVKISVSETGIYEISYDSLRSYGFQHPENVGIFGTGGWQLPSNFLDKDGNKAFSCSLPAMKVIHSNDKLIFFAKGVEQIRPGTNKSGKSVYLKTGRNPYSQSGYYFLTDSRKPERPDEFPGNDPSDAKRIDHCMSYVYHEKELKQNMSLTGNLYWGEPINKYSGNCALTPYTVFDADLTRPARMQCIVHLERNIPGTFSFGPENGGTKVSAQLRNPATLTRYCGIEPSEGEIILPSDTGYIKTGVQASDWIDIGALDYWIISYDRSIPSLTNETSAIFCLPDIKSGEIIELPVFDKNHILLSLNRDYEVSGIIPIIEKDEEYVAIFNSPHDSPEFVILDSASSLQQIGSAKTIASRDIFSLSDLNAELLIITNDILRPSAERLAGIHSLHDKFSTEIVTIEELYDAFSSGRPDPMAYRSMAKFLYEKGNHKLKNVLLFGPMLADMITKDESTFDPFEQILAIQCGENGEANPVPNVNDFYGNMTDYTDDAIFRWNNLLGVGILPVHKKEEADRICDKIERYITSKDHVYTLNRFFTSGGVGDNHLHAKQAVNLARYSEKASSGKLVISSLINSTYNDGESANRFADQLNKSGITSYFGHGNPTVIDSSKKLFAMSDMHILKNSNLPFMLFAGCNISNTDRGVRGIGESLILETTKGLIGAILANRDTWANRNYEFMSSFLRKTLSEYKKTPDNTTLTVGEIYARTKEESLSDNELSYNLYCDPSLRIVYPKHSIHLDTKPKKIKRGDSVTLTGTIVNSNNECISSYSGQIYISLLAPEDSIAAQNIGTKDNGTFKYKRDAYVLSSMTGKVDNGIFNIRFRLPEKGYSCTDTLSFALSAYDSTTRVGAASRFYFVITDKDEPSYSGTDTTPPTVDLMDFDGQTGILFLKISDDKALDMSQTPFSEGVSLKIDGQEFSPARTTLKVPVQNETSYTVTLPLPEFSRGYHDLTLTVADEAGNTTVRNMRILEGETDAKLAIFPESRVFLDEARFNQTGDIIAGDFIFYVSDSSGKTIVREEKSGTSFSWNLMDSENKRVLKGLYQAYILSMDKTGNGNHSAPVFFTVADK